MLAVHITFDCVALFERSLQNSTAASSRCAIFKVEQASMDGHGREMYRKSDGASGDAYVTVLTHDRVQPAGKIVHKMKIMNMTHIAEHQKAGPGAWPAAWPWVWRMG